MKVYRLSCRAMLLWTLLVLATLVAAVAVVEVALRLRYGLGNPPLYQFDEEFEYMMKPSAEYRRHGNRVQINAFGMRSDPVFERTDPKQLRILMLGDSVIQGGDHVDQDDIASERLKRRLIEHTGRDDVVVANASAASWGPPNLLRYVQRYGLFEADVIIVVMSSHDHADVPSGRRYVGYATRPDVKPKAAIHELWQRLSMKWRHRRKPPAPAEPSAADIEFALGDYRQLLQTCGEGGALVVAALHLERSEHERPHPGHEMLARIAERHSDLLVQLGPRFVAETRAGRNPYHDNIHPNARGQQLIAEVLLDALAQAGMVDVTASANEIPRRR